MTAALLGGILSGLPVLLVIAGIPILTAALASTTGHFDLSFLQAAPQRVFGIMENPLLIAVPLFVLVGVLLERSGQAERMLRTLAQALGQSRSGLIWAVLGVSALIAASTGIIGATIVMLGLIGLPALLTAGVPQRTASGLICAAGTLGQIIPPSIVLVLLGDQVSNAYLDAQQAAGNFAPDPVTVADLFAGALLPGLLLVALYGLYAVMALRREPAKAPAAPSGGALGRLAVEALPTLALILAVLGSILIGLATPTEAAAIGVAGTILITAGTLSPRARSVAIATAGLAAILVTLRGAGLLRADFDAGALAATPMTLTAVGLLVLVGLGLAACAATLHRGQVLLPALTETLTVAGMIFGIVIAASILSLVVRGFGGDAMVEGLLTALPGGAWGMLAATLLIVFLMGFLLEFVEIIYIVIPIVGPILLQSDIDPVWFAVLIAMNLQTSFLTPPFGFALFYFRAVAPAEIKTATIYAAIAPFVLIQILALGLVLAFPPLATWLPSVIFG